MNEKTLINNGCWIYFVLYICIIITVFDKTEIVLLFNKPRLENRSQAYNRIRKNVKVKFVQKLTIYLEIQVYFSNFKYNFNRNCSML